MDGTLERLEGDWKLVKEYRNLDADDPYARAELIKAFSERGRAESNKTVDIDAWMAKVVELYQGVSKAMTRDERNTWLAKIQKWYESNRFPPRDYRVRGELPHSDTEPKIPEGSHHLEETLADSSADPKKREDFDHLLHGWGKRSPGRKTA